MRRGGEPTDTGSTRPEQERLRERAKEPARRPLRLLIGQIVTVVVLAAAIMGLMLLFAHGGA